MRCCNTAVHSTDFTMRVLEIPNCFHLLFMDACSKTSRSCCQHDSEYFSLLGQFIPTAFVYARFHFALADVRATYAQARIDLDATHKRRCANAERAYNQGIHIGAGCETPSSINGRHRWNGLVAHAAVYDRPLTRQDAFIHWFAGVCSSGKCFFVL